MSLGAASAEDHRARVCQIGGMEMRLRSFLRAPFNSPAAGPHTERASHGRQCGGAAAAAGHEEERGEREKQNEKELLTFARLSDPRAAGASFSRS